MKKIDISLNLDNDAMQSPMELSSVLVRLANHFHGQRKYKNESGSLLDSNGRSVGTFSVTGCE